MSNLLEIHSSIRAMTRDCRNNMHEPDEQGLGAVVIGRGLDNAFCAHDFDPNPPRKGLNLTLLLRRDDGQILNLNIADLLALARVADIGKILDIDQES